MSQANVPTTELNNLTDSLATNTAPSFAVGGIVTTNRSGPSSFTVQADGKILLGGGIVSGISWIFELERYNTDGSLDLSFDGDGKINTALGNESTSRSVAMQADGKILLGGYSWRNNKDFALVRYNTDGSLDTSFNGDDIVTTDLGGNYDSGYSVTMQADGKILLGGGSWRNNYDFALVRYNTDGSLDTGFDGDGIVTTDVGGEDYGQSVTAQADGKILLGGSSYDNKHNDNFALVRYNTDGSLDLSFDGDGIVVTAVPNYSASSFDVQADGKILLGGSMWSGHGWNFALMRYNTDGSLDLSFSDDGKLSTGLGGQGEGISVTVQADGKILLGGSNWRNNYDFALVRYNIDGSLDLSFSDDGKVTTDLGGEDYGQSVTVQADGKILLGGYSDHDFALLRYNTDGSLDNSFNPNPVSTLNSKSGYHENGKAIVLDRAVQIYDAELAAQGNYNGASVTLARHGGANAEDVFSGKGQLKFNGSAAVLSGVTIGTVSNSNGTLSINFNSDATQTRVDDVLSSIAYSNTTDNPPTPTTVSVQIDWLFNDGNTGKQGIGDVLTTTGSINVNILANHDEVIGTTENDSLWGRRRSLADKIYGFAGNDVIDGRRGNDTLDGGEGSDYFIGGLGADNLSGGLGADTFIYKITNLYDKAVPETGITATTRDTIIDFTRNQGDKIDLSAIDANTALKGNNAFAAPTIGGAFSGTFAHPGELYFNQTAHILYGNNDADSIADLSIMVMGVTNLRAADFVL